MKAILLQTPALDNGGARRDAGEQLTIGEEAGEITLDRAEALVNVMSAVDVSPPPPAKKAD
jgi:hypothetical protein